jgi:(p)ppGpp synthase/HD superfamily hydrolase
MKPQVNYSGELLNAALVLATNAHAGQYDKSGRPYILHPLKVMHYLKSDDEILQCIALLHDVVEDCDITYDMIFDTFKVIDQDAAQYITEGVRSVTKEDGESYADYKAKVFKNRRGMLVKREDLRHNSDIRRLLGVTQRDINRTVRYYQFFLEIEEKLTHGQVS